jgi:hypothetical protein
VKRVAVQVYHGSALLWTVHLSRSFPRSLICKTCSKLGLQLRSLLDNVASFKVGRGRCTDHVQGVSRFRKNIQSRGTSYDQCKTRSTYEHLLPLSARLVCNMALSDLPVAVCSLKSPFNRAPNPSRLRQWSTTNIQLSSTSSIRKRCARSSGRIYETGERSR